MEAANNTLEPELNLQDDNNVMDVSSEKNEEERVLPQPAGKKPKHPKNGFFYYALKYREEVTAKHPKLDNRGISCLLGQIWKKMSQEERRPYEEKFEEDMMLKEKHPDWVYTPEKNIGEDTTIQEIAVMEATKNALEVELNLQDDNNMMDVSSEKNEEERVLPQPAREELKRPKNGFIRFAMKYRKETAAKYPKLDNRNISCLLGQIWKTMSQKERRPYEEIFEKDMKRLKETHPDWAYSTRRNIGEDKSIEVMPTRLRPQEKRKPKNYQFFVPTLIKKSNKQKRKISNPSEKGNLKKSRKDLQSITSVPTSSLETIKVQNISTSDEKNIEIEVGNITDSDEKSIVSTSSSKTFKDEYISDSDGRSIEIKVENISDSDERSVEIKVENISDSEERSNENKTDLDDTVEKPRVTTPMRNQVQVKNRICKKHLAKSLKLQPSQPVINVPLKQPSQPDINVPLKQPSQPVINVPLKQKRSLVVPNHEKLVMSNLSSLWKTGKLCDASISNGNVDVMVHKLVFAAACPNVLDIMSNTPPYIFQRVTFPNTVSKEALLAFAEYMYTGVLDLDPDILVQMKVIAHYLNMKAFDNLCSSQLASLLPQNIPSTSVEPKLTEECSSSGFIGETEWKCNQTPVTGMIPPSNKTHRKDVFTANSITADDTLNNSLSDLPLNGSAKTDYNLNRTVDNGHAFSSADDKTCDLPMTSTPFIKVERVDPEDELYGKAPVSSCVDYSRSDSVFSNTNSSQSTTSSATISQHTNDTLNKSLTISNVWTQNINYKRNSDAVANSNQPHPVALFMTNVPSIEQEIKKEYNAG